MNVYDQAHGLARSLQKHPDVLAMQAAKAKVDQDPQAKEMLDNFMAKSMELQMRQMSGEDISDAEIEQLNKQAEIVFLHSDIRDFQELAMRVERMLQDIYRILGEALQLTEQTT